jgi:hypothetical protein
VVLVLFAMTPAGTPATAASQRVVDGPHFVDETAAASIDFLHHHGGTGDKQLPETMGAGVAWLDYDRDGRHDLYFVDSGPLPQSMAARPPTGTSRQGQVVGANVLYRGLPDGTFRQVSGAGASDRGYGQGVSVADYDADGFPDLYVTNVGRNTLLRNNGDGTFADVTDSAGIGGESWSVSSAWGDLDGDGLSELYVANYLRYDLANPLYCGAPLQGIRSYCHISLFEGAADALYRNDADGTFTDISRDALGDPRGKGLGVVMGHVDGDELLDIYVANDTTQNLLYRNAGELTFEEAGLVTGVGFASDGRPQAGMGTDIADLDGDGVMEIVVNNFAFEPTNVYRAAAPGFFLDDTYALGIGAVTYPTLGFGLALADFDADGDLDMVIANGHILDDVERIKDNATYAQPNQLLVNRLDEMRSSGAAESAVEPDLFVEATAAAGEALATPRVSRGLAAADFTGDGLPDLAISNSNDAAQLLRTDTRGAGARVVVRLIGRQSPRDGVGSRIRARPVDAGRASLYEVRAGSSYASSHATDVYLGLGDRDAVSIEVLWASGHRESIVRLPAGALYVVIEGLGVIATRPLADH